MSEREKREFAQVVALQFQYFLGQREKGRLLDHEEERECHRKVDDFLPWFFGSAPKEKSA